MKKKTLALGLAAVLTMSMLTGCGASKEDYENDMKEITEGFTEMATASDQDAMKDVVDDIEVSTSQGKAIKKDLKKMAEADEDIAEDKAEKMIEDLGDDIDAFVEAAEKKEVSGEEIAAFKLLGAMF